MVTCQDCGDDIIANMRRIRCQHCGLLCCRWCFYHHHGLVGHSDQPVPEESRPGLRGEL